MAGAICAITVPALSVHQLPSKSGFLKAPTLLSNLKAVLLPAEGKRSDLYGNEIPQMLSPSFCFIANLVSKMLHIR